MDFRTPVHGVQARLLVDKGEIANPIFGENLGNRETDPVRSRERMGFRSEKKGNCAHAVGSFSRYCFRACRRIFEMVLVSAFARILAFSARSPGILTRQISRFSVFCFFPRIATLLPCWQLLSRTKSCAKLTAMGL